MLDCGDGIVFFGRVVPDYCFKLGCGLALVPVSYDVLSEGGALCCVCKCDGVMGGGWWVCCIVVRCGVV